MCRLLPALAESDLSPAEPAMAKWYLDTVEAKGYDTQITGASLKDEVQTEWR